MPKAAHPGEIDCEIPLDQLAPEPAHWKEQAELLDQLRRACGGSDSAVTVGIYYFGCFDHIPMSSVEIFKVLDEAEWTPRLRSSDISSIVNAFRSVSAELWQKLMAIRNRPMIDAVPVKHDSAPIGARDPSKKIRLSTERSEWSRPVEWSRQDDHKGRRFDER